MTLRALKPIQTRGLEDKSLPKSLRELFPGDSAPDVSDCAFIDAAAYQREIKVQAALPENKGLDPWSVRFLAWQKTLHGENTPGPVPVA